MLPSLNTADDRQLLRRVLDQPSRGLVLLEFQTLPQLAEILAEFRQLHPARPLVELAYDPPRENAALFLDRARTRLAESPRDPLPLLVLRPVELPVEPLEDPARAEFRQALVDFWRAMNFRREAWGELPAQLLLCVDPAHHERLIHLAADLRDWAMPKLHLRPDSAGVALRSEALGAFAGFAESHLSPAAAEMQWQSLWPALEKARQTSRLTPGHLRRYVFPLLEAALAQGNLVRARQVRAAAEGLCPGPADLVRWHELLARLAVGEGGFDAAEQHARHLLVLTEESHERSVQTAAVGALISVGNLLGRFGHAEVAEWLFRQIVVRATALWGPENPATLKSRNNLANTLSGQGKHAEAEREYRAVLGINERVLGAEHPNSLTSRNNFASALWSQGTVEEAEREYRTVLGIRERVQGPEHPHTLKSHWGVAIVLQGQGKHVEAETVYRRILPIMERVQGPEHPDTLSCRNNLTAALFAQGKHAEAERELRAVLAIEERVLGAEHPYTLTSHRNLTIALADQGKHSEAEREHRALIAIEERMLGADHPETLRSCFNLAIALRNQGKNEEAKPFAQRAYEVGQRVFGEQHPFVPRSKALWEQLQSAK